MYAYLFSLLILNSFIYSLQNYKSCKCCSCGIKNQTLNCGDTILPDTNITNAILDAILLDKNNFLKEFTDEQFKVNRR